MREGSRWQRWREMMYLEEVELTSNPALRLITMWIGSIPPNFNDLGPNTYLHSTMTEFLAIECEFLHLGEWGLSD